MAAGDFKTLFSRDAMTESDAARSPAGALAPAVQIYTKWGCGYCYRAKALLDGKGVAYEEIDITMGGPRRAEMLARANGRTTVPQIFVGEVHVGGSDDLAALERTGKLDMLLGR
jgi:glutaredoxin 3